MPVVDIVAGVHLPVHSKLGGMYNITQGNTALVIGCRYISKL